MSAKRSRRRNNPSTSPVNLPVPTSTPPVAAAPQTPTNVATPSLVADDTPESSAVGCFARLYWMMWGNFAVIVCALVVARQGDAWGSADIVYWLFAASLPWVRRIDMLHGEGNDHMGHKADMQGWRRYTIFIVAVCLALWLLAHWAGYAMLRGK